MGNQNNNQNQTQNNQGQQRTNVTADLLAKSVDIKPVGVMYNITGAMVENFIEAYLTKKGVNGIANVKVLLRNEGRNTPNVAAYLFISRNSSGIISNENAVPPMLRGKIDKVNLRLTDDLKQTLVPIAGQEFKAGKAEHGEYYVKLNIFLVLGLMFSAVQGKHTLTIPAASSIPGSKDCVISVVKQELYQRASGGNKDNYSRQVEYFEKNYH